MNNENNLIKKNNEEIIEAEVIETIDETEAPKQEPKAEQQNPNNNQTNQGGYTQNNQQYTHQQANQYGAYNGNPNPYQQAAYGKQYKKAQEKAKPVRRVGTMTMGLSLIAAGAASIYALLNPAFNIVTVAKLTPVILIFLGIEILISTIFFKGEKLKYDFLSGFVCFMLICASIALAVAGPLLDHFGPARYATQERLADEIEQQYFSKLSGNKAISTFEVYVDLSDMDLDTDMTIADIDGADYVRMQVTFNKEYQNELEFATDVKEVLEQIDYEGLKVDNISFQNYTEKAEYRLNVHDRFQMNKDAAALAKLVEKEVYGDMEERYAQEQQAIEEETQVEHSEVM